VPFTAWWEQESITDYHESQPLHPSVLDNTYIPDDKTCGNFVHSQHTILQCPPDIPASAEYFDDARHVLGTAAYRDDHLVDAEPPFTTADIVNGLDSFTPMPLKYPMSIVYPDEDFSPASALPQDQVIGYAPPTAAAAQSSSQGPLTCPNGCSATFSRPGEYRRHMKKHGGRSFPCTQPGCSMSFYRRDKLRDHLRQLHKM
jgi:hypothetical protein